MAMLVGLEEVKDWGAERGTKYNGICDFTA